MKSSNYLPPEVWTQILITLPAKTLVRFRCVCKSWCSIIDNPDFIHTHFQLCKINSGNNNKLLVALEFLGRNGDEDYEYLLTVRQAETLRNLGRIFSKSDSYSYKIMGSCNGLLLVARHGPPCYLKELRLWNPCIRKSLVIPTYPLPSSLCDPELYVFGFAPDSRDYKVVKLAFGSSQDEESGDMYFAVYTLNNQQWTVRNDPVNVSILNIYDRRGLFYFVSTAVFFRGSAYWLAEKDKYMSGLFTHLGSFDFDRESITFLELPISLEKSYCLSFLFLLGGSLAVFRMSSATSSIWVLDQNNQKDPWTLWFSGKSSFQGFLLLKRHGSRKKIFYCEKDGGYFFYGKKAYNIVSCQVHELNNSMSSYLDLEMYSETLMLSTGYGARDLRFFP
ncbi:F-box/kelch-repeat protein At3g23880-like [Silene latifolia]|uniref:F-box/kelch-repeat protein At3g23880-like n=1 Tax=Silene latifolia TaxID=37657 RepID=UPI003D76AE5C